MLQVVSDARMPLGRLPLALTQPEGSLKEQLEPELIVLRRGEPAIHQVIEPDEEASGMGTQGGAEDGAGESTDKRAEDKWPDARTGGPLGKVGVRINRRMGIR
jgi:hypothetical protein